MNKFVVGFETVVGVIHWDGKSDSAQLVDELFDLKDQLGPNESVSFGHQDLIGHSLYVATQNMRLCGASADQSVYVKQKGSKYRRILSNMIMPHGFAFTDDYVYVIDACTFLVWELKNSKTKGAHGMIVCKYHFKNC